MQLPKDFYNVSKIQNQSTIKLPVNQILDLIHEVCIVILI